jgi:hypothetical protein
MLVAAVPDLCVGEAAVLGHDRRSVEACTSRTGLPAGERFLFQTRGPRQPAGSFRDQLRVPADELHLVALRVLEEQ